MRKSLFIYIALLIIGQASAQTDSSTVTPDTAAAMDTGKTYIVEINKLLYTAQANLGTPYRYAGKKTRRFRLQWICFILL